MSIQRMAVLCGLAWALSACGTSPDDLQPGQGRGKQFEVTGKNYDQVWRAALGAMARDMTIVEQDRSAGVIKSRVDTGKVVAIFIAPTAPRAERYTILLMSKKPMESRYIDRDFEPTVAEDFMRRLEP
jgi:hypothetical protein